MKFTDGLNYEESMIIRDFLEDKIYSKSNLYIIQKHMKILREELEMKNDEVESLRSVIKLLTKEG